MQGDTPTGPNLFLVGAPKCGTTSLYEYLRQHPQVFFPHRDGQDYSLAKEPQHFCPDLDIGPRYSIRDRADYLALYRDTGASRWRGDASTYYLYSKAAPGLIRQFNPQARILVMLRPPLEMMHSYHSELLRWGGLEDIADFHEAIAASGARSNGERLPHNRGVAKCLDYFAISRFAPQVEHYIDVFGRSAVKVILLEDLSTNPEETYRSILEFLDVDPTFMPEFRVYNEAPGSSKLEHLLHTVHAAPVIRQMSNAVFPYPLRRRLVSRLRRRYRGRVAQDPRDAALQERCKPDIERLSILIGRDLSHWM
ncbi:MAG: sulfotransferase [Rhodanobacteraceae bacterium]